MKRKWIIALVIFLALGAIAGSWLWRIYHRPLPDWLVVSEGARVIVSYRSSSVAMMFSEGVSHYLRMEWPGEPKGIMETISKMLETNGFESDGPPELLTTDNMGKAKFVNEWPAPYLMSPPKTGGLGMYFQNESSQSFVKVAVWPRGDKCLVQVIEEKMVTEY